MDFDGWFMDAAARMSARGNGACGNDDTQHPTRVLLPYVSENKASLLFISLTEVV
jgi:hypothetical protein